MVAVRLVSDPEQKARKNGDLRLRQERSAEFELKRLRARFECYHCVKCSQAVPFSRLDLGAAGHTYLQQVYTAEVSMPKPLGLRSCQSCWPCPHNIDCLFDEAVRRKARPGIIGQKDIDRFNELFLNNIDYFGRSHEMVLAGLYNLTTGHLFQDVTTAPKMYFNKLIRITPHIVWNQGQVRRILKRTRKRGDNQ